MLNGSVAAVELISQLVVIALFLLSGCFYYSECVVQASKSSCDRMFPFKLSPAAEIPCLSSVANVSIVGLYQSLQRELDVCDWKKFVLVTQYGFNINLLEYIRLSFTSGDLSSALNYEIELKSMEASAIAETIWNAYYKQRVFNFIWITRQHKVVIESAHTLFGQQSCGFGALMTSRINFIFVTFTANISDIALEMASSLFDNLAVFAFSEYPTALEGAYTHMWRTNRSREFQEIGDLNNVSSSTSADVCKIFPNIKNGFNGRHLFGLAKEWLPEFYKDSNELTGKTEYSGFYIDVFDTLAATLNFTYTLVPPPDKEDNMSWTAYTKMVSECEVDFGINLFTNNAIFHYNTSTSFPVLYSNYIGAYINRSKPNPYKIFLVFKLNTYLVVIGLLLVTVLLYLLLTHSPRLSEECLFMPESHTRDQKLTENQIYQLHVHRSSAFEIDWQEKYKFLESHESPHYDQMNMHRKRQMCYQNNSHYTSKHVRWRIHGLNKINFTQMHFKFKKSIIQYFAKFYSNKIMKNNQNKNKTSRIMKKTHTNYECGKHKHLRDGIYNNSSHYITKYARKECYVSFEYQTKQRVIPQQNLKRGSALKQVDAQSLKTMVIELLEILSVRQHYLFDVHFGFLGTLVNQGTLPDAVHWAPRVLLGAWSFMMIVLVATYNGNLTAAFADTTEDVPIKSFDELLSKGDYRWGTWNETLVYSLLEASGPGTTLHRLYEGIERFSKTDPSVLGDLGNLISHIKSGKFVALISSFIFEYFEDYTDLPGLTVIPDILLTANGGFVFPNNSELNLAISRQLIAMRDSGITNHIFHKLKLRNTTTMALNEDSSNVYLNMDNVAGLFYISGYGLIISLGALVMEILISKFR